MRRRSLLSALATATVLVLTFSSAAMGRSDHRTVNILDNCDGPSFNAALGPGACVRKAGLTFDKLNASLAKGGAPSWRFAPGRVTLAAGGTITATNRGGEFHTFTSVAAFGGGCVPPINAALGLSPVPECANPAIIGMTGVPAGLSLTTAPLAAGTYFFQCLIHPWQKATVRVG